MDPPLLPFLFSPREVWAQGRVGMLPLGVAMPSPAGHGPWTVRFRRTCRGDLVQCHCTDRNLVGKYLGMLELGTHRGLLHLLQKGTVTCPESPRSSVSEPGLALGRLPFYPGILLLHSDSPTLLNSYTLFQAGSSVRPCCPIAGCTHRCPAVRVSWLWALRG